MIIEVFKNICTLDSLLFMNIGIAAGVMFGSMPGLTATMGVALLLPLTFSMDSIVGMMLLLGVYCGGTYGGSITAILINTPGTPAAASTVLDGYQMAKKGKASLALEMALKASVFGGIFSTVALMLIAPQLAEAALEFGPPEYFALCVFGLTIISSVGSDSVYKGLLMGLLGLAASTIGIDPITGYNRMTFGVMELSIGIKLIPALIGLFAVSEIMEKSRAINDPVGQVIEYIKETLPWKAAKKYWKTILKSSVIGTFIGAVPGTGTAIAGFLGYNEARRSSKIHANEEFGQGCIEGVAASEAANNAVTGAALIPLLTLGIPGDTVTAILLGALMMQGITPGPRLFETQANWVYAIMLGLFFINLFMYVQGKLFIKLFANVNKVPAVLLVPILVVLCIIGAYATGVQMFDVYVCLIFGVIGYIASRFNYPVTPMVIAIVLGSTTESNMRRSLILSGGDPSIFFTRPICVVFLGLAAIMLFAPLFKGYLKKKKENATV